MGVFINGGVKAKIYAYVGRASVRIFKICTVGLTEYTIQWFHLYCLVDALIVFMASK